MTHEEKIKYMKIAAGMVGYSFEMKHFDMLVSLYDLVVEKGGDTDLKMVCKVEAEVEERALERAKKALPQHYEEVSK